MVNELHEGKQEVAISHFGLETKLGDEQAVRDINNIRVVHIELVQLSEHVAR